MAKTDNLKVLVEEMIADLVFKQNGKGEIVNTKNRYAEEWTSVVNEEVVNTLLASKKIKVSYIDNNNEIHSNFEEIN